MRRNANDGGTRSVLAVCLIVAAGCSQPEPDPRIYARELARERVREPRPLREQPAEPVVASFDFSTRAASPAPLGEARRGAEPMRRTSVLLGNNAAGAVETGVTAALTSDGSGSALETTTCPDRDAVELMLQGRADFAVIAGKLSPRDEHAGLRQTQLGVELWGLAVAASSPLRSLTRAQLRKVLTGEIRDFVDLGQTNGAITVFVPADTGVAQRAAKALTPGDPLGAMCTAIVDEGFDAALRNPGAIGVVRAGVTPLAADVRLLAIDWSPPTVDAFRFGTYPFGAPLTLVTSGQPLGAAATLLAFARSSEGRAMLGRTMLPMP